MWLDDVRLPPDGWVWVKTVDEAMKLLLTGTVDHASLDHDLGGQPAEEGKPYDWQEPDGTALVKRMIRENAFPNVDIIVHSVNSAAGPRMAARLKDMKRVPVRWIPEFNLRRTPWKKE